MYRSTQVTHVLYADILVCLSALFHSFMSKTAVDLTMMHVSLFIYSVSVLLTITFSGKFSYSVFPSLICCQFERHGFELAELQSV